MQDDDEDVSQEAVLVCQQLSTLLPPLVAAQSTRHAVERLHAHATEEAVLQAVRLFAHTAESMSPEAVESMAPALLQHWCTHRDFLVREVGRLRGLRRAGHCIDPRSPAAAAAATPPSSRLIPRLHDAACAALTHRRTSAGAQHGGGCLVLMLAPWAACSLPCRRLPCA